MVIAMQEDWYSSLGYDHLWCTASRTRNVVPNFKGGKGWVNLTPHTAKPKTYPKRPLNILVASLSYSKRTPTTSCKARRKERHLRGRVAVGHAAGSERVAPVALCWMPAPC